MMSFREGNTPPPMEPRRLQQLCGELLGAEGYMVLPQNPRYEDMGVDFVVQAPNGGEDIAVEVKTAGEVRSLSHWREVIYELSAYKRLLPIRKGILMTNTAMVPPQVVEELAIMGFELWDGVMLADLFMKHIERVRRYQYVLANSRKGAGGDPLDAEPRAKDLYQRLTQLSAGWDHWRAYEELGIEIMNYLFIPPFLPPQVQTPSDDGLDRPDATYPMRHTEKQSTWSRIAHECRSRMVVVDFKNLSEGPTQVEIEDIEQYLYPKAMRTVGLLCCRKKPQDSALKARRRAWVKAEAGVLVVLLSDEDLKRMIRLKVNGDDPAEVIDEQLDHFFMNLSP